MKWRHRVALRLVWLPFTRGFTAGLEEGARAEQARLGQQIAALQARLRHERSS